MQRHLMALTWQKHTTVILSFRPSTEYRELLERSWSPHEVILCLFGLRKQLQVGRARFFLGCKHYDLE